MESRCCHTRQPFVEIIPLLCRFQLCVIHRKAFDKIVLQDRIRPTPELCATRGTHTKANREDHVEVIVQGAIGFAVSGSCQVFLDN